MSGKKNQAPFAIRTKIGRDSSWGKAVDNGAQVGAVGDGASRKVFTGKGDGLMAKVLSENGWTRKELLFDLRQKTKQFHDAEERVKVVENQIKAIRQELGTLPVRVQ